MTAATAPTGLRVGQGFDIHPFVSGGPRPLVLGGVTIPGHRGLEGHSDADVVCHALADALLGAAGLGDLGGHFPASDPRWAGADSTALLAAVVTEVAGAGWSVVNADCTVVCDQPRLAAHTSTMEAVCAPLLGAPVSIKAKGAEGLGALGRVEGIACLAVVLLAAVAP